MNYDDFKVGYKGEYKTTITAEKNKEFGDLVGDHNPVHFDEKRMQKSIFKHIVTNGFLTESTIGAALVKMFVTDECVVIALKKEIKLVAPVYIGETITAVVIVAERFHEKKRLLCDCIVKKEDGTKVVEAKFLVKILDV